MHAHVNTQSDSMDQIAARLAELDESLASARGEIGALRGRLDRATRRRNAAVALGAIAALAGFSRSKTIAPSGQTITAPFTVVDEAGATMFEVRRSKDGATSLLNLLDDGKVALQVSAGASGGMLTVRDKSEQSGVALGIDRAGSGELAVWNAEGKRIADILRGEKGGQGIGVYGDGNKLRGELYGTKDVAIVSVEGNVIARTVDHQPVARLGMAIASIERGAANDTLKGAGGNANGDANSDANSDKPDAESRWHDGLAIFGAGGTPVIQAFKNLAGNGTVSVHSSTDMNAGARLGVAQGGPVMTLKSNGIIQLSFGVLGNKPEFNMSNSGGLGIVALAQAANGGGMFQLSDLTGRPTVEGGTLENGHGIVRAGPFFQCGGTFAGLIQPDCILGKGGRE